MTPRGTVPVWCHGRTTATSSCPGKIERQKQIKILARSLHKQLTSEGYDDKQIVALATELLSEVTDQVRPATRSG